jgi:hypothetical protein
VWCVEASLYPEVDSVGRDAQDGHDGHLRRRYLRTVAFPLESLAQIIALRLTFKIPGSLRVVPLMMKINGKVGNQVVGFRLYFLGCLASWL